MLRRILFVRTDRLGDTLLNLPAVTALQAAAPQASVTLLVHPDLQPLLSGLPGIDVQADRTSADAPWWLRAVRLSRQLSSGEFDCAIVSNPKKDLHLAVWLAGIPVRVGYGRKWGWLLTHRLADRKASGERHEVESNLELARALGLPLALTSWSFPPFRAEQEELFRWPEFSGLSPDTALIAVHPFSSNPAKQWPPGKFQEMIREVAASPARVVVIGGPEERCRTDQMIPSGNAAVNLVGRLTLRQLAGLLQRVRLLVSNDSGPVHLAAAVGTPTVVLFGGTDPATGPRRWGPWGSGHTVLHRPQLSEIPVDEVLKALHPALACRRPTAYSS
jgi:heptosyltransferase-2